MKHEFSEINDHGMIGDLQSVALINTDGCIDWFCAPRFDSPSIFASMLDPVKGGFFQIRPAEPVSQVRQMYFPETACLITRFFTENGVAELIDFMPINEPHSASTNRRIARGVRVVRGHLTFELDCRPRFDYARQQHQARGSDAGIIFETGESRALLRGVEADAITDDGDVRLSFSLANGQLRSFVWETDPSEEPAPLTEADGRRLFAETVDFWRTWIAQCTYTGRWREQVERSAIVLKLLTYAPSGAMVAAPTTALPEQVGGTRNWDYRYTWIRDTSLSLHALLRLGYEDEARAFGIWLRDRGMEQVGDASGPLKVMYRVDGSSDLEEAELHDFEGYRGSRPVNIGNGAADQLQLDIYGEALNSIDLSDQLHPINHAGWIKLVAVVDWLCENWHQPDEGVWETRGGRKNFTYGRVMSWVALDRAIRMAQRRGRPAPLARWIQTRDDIYHDVFTHGWNAERQAFVQHSETTVVDAINLMMPVVGIISSTDPMWLSTLDAIEEELVIDSLVYRYNPAASPDGLPGDEGTFSLCSFFWVRALVDAGQLEKARYAFEKMLTYGNHVGLFSEEIDAAGHGLGNFPQAFTHLALIHAAIELDTALNAGHEHSQMGMTQNAGRQ